MGAEDTVRRAVLPLQLLVGATVRGCATGHLSESKVPIPVLGSPPPQEEAWNEIMSMRLGALHDALLDPGNAEKAQRAAEEVAGYDSRLAAIDARLLVLQWMVGANIAFTFIVLGKVLML